MFDNQNPTDVLWINYNLVLQNKFVKKIQINRWGGLLSQTYTLQRQDTHLAH